MPNPAAHRLVLTAFRHHQQGQLAQAQALYRQALSIEPTNPDALHLLGVIALQTGNPAQTIDLVSKAIAIDPRQPEFHSNLALAYNGVGELDKAAEHFRKALALKPAFAEVQNNLANLYKSLGQIPQALECYQKAIALKPDYVAAQSNRLLALNYIDSDPQWVAGEHRRWAEAIESSLASSRSRPHINDRNPNRRLRIGYVSPDFNEHAVSFFFEPLLANHDRAQFDIFCYSDVDRPDAITQRLRTYPATWREILHVPDEKVAELIRQDQNDILVDLTGHTQGNRLLAFARKPAPIQITYLGYPNTTGLSSMDYRLTDSFADPADKTDSLHTEKLLRLPQSAWCYRPYQPSPAVGPLPALTNGHITFGSFNNFAKITPHVLDTWALLLSRVPNSHLLIKARGLQVPSLQQRILSHFARQQITEDRIHLHPGHTSYVAHLETYHQVDIALDTFPYTGATTTFEALHMGVPVVTPVGAVHASRVGVSILTNLGLPDLIASSLDDYLRLAIALASDVNQLQNLRASLRPMLAKSPLCDEPRFTRDVEAIYRQVWTQWCR